jgi:5-methyltetrahydrofolate--homocysteine methyltransferase
MTVRQKLDGFSKKRVLLLDGAMGTLIQQYKLREEDFRGTRFLSCKERLAGCNDLLCLTKPDLIGDIHERYLEAGADIIESCSFNANALSLADYGLSDFAYEISRAAAAIAKRAAQKYSSDEKPRFVAGVLGPLGKSASISPDIDDPEKRSVYFDEIEAAYYDNARGLLDGGADILMLETIFDTLNAKAGICAIMRLMRERALDIPLMLSAAISDSSGRLLSGQTVQAFCVSVLHAIRENNTGLFSIGLNCSLGAERMKHSVRELAAIAPCMVSAHPNAGLPDEFGQYQETPQAMAAFLSDYIDEGLVNIVGGCCGSTPEHIKALSRMIAGRPPRIIPPYPSGKTYLSGLEAVCIDHSAGLFVVGERGNVSGSRKLLGLIKENKLNDALGILRENIAEGIDAIDISMDDALIDSKTVMTRFMHLALSDPAIAKIPFVIDSSDFSVIEAALKCLQGRAIANSVSLKEGEAEFVRKALRIRDLGAIPMVMLFDEKGQAATEERKVEIAKRAYGLLVKNHIRQEDIVIDPNVLAIATGIEDHNRYALDFINACRIITQECPGVKISAGVSNLSFSFRGNSGFRNIMNAIFLKLAFEAGLSLAIVNASATGLYDSIDRETRKIIEDALLYKGKNSSETLLELAKKYHVEKKIKEPCEDKKESQDPRQRIIFALLSGTDDTIESDVNVLLQEKVLPLEIIEGPLMDGMREISRRFGRGEIFLPELIRCARVMKKAVALLEIVLARTNSNTQRKEKIILATVKGDVHDIGKNIVATVLGCNGFDIIDLGVMVDAEIIVERAIKEKACFVGLSGLITPSLSEMCVVTELMEKNRLDIPLLVGGAASSLAHTALKIVPLYSSPVVYVADAGAAPEAVRSLLSPTLRPRFLEELENRYRNAASHHYMIEASREIIPLEEARKNRPVIDWLSYKDAMKKNTENRALPVREVEYMQDYPLEKIIPFIDWVSFAKKLDMDKDKNKNETQKLIADAHDLLEHIQKNKTIQLCGALSFYPALSLQEDIILYDTALENKKEIARLFFLRNQTKKPKGGANPSLADFILPAGEAGHGETDYIGFFVLSAGLGVEEEKQRLRACHDDYGLILTEALADTLVEAFSEETHQRMIRQWGACQGGIGGIRPAFGYPCLADHEDKRLVFSLLGIEENMPLSLTSSAMIHPAASLCGMYILNPDSYYFALGKIADDQLSGWAEKKNINLKEAQKRIGVL